LYLLFIDVLAYPKPQRLLGYKILLKAAIASGSVDSYVEKFLLEDGIDVERLPADRLAKIKRYLEMFSELQLMIIINPFFSPHSIHRQDGVVQFRGGQAAGLPASNEQASA